VFLSYTKTILASHYTFPASSKLERLKQATLSYRQGKNVVSKKYNPKFIYSIISLLLVIILISLNISSAFAATRNNFQAKQSLLTNLVSQLINSPQENLTNQITQEIEQATLPISQLAGGDYLTKYMIQDVASTLREYTDTISPLTQYTISKSGFTHKLDKSKVFTQELVSVLTKLEYVYANSKDTYNSYWVQRTLLWSMGGKSIRENLSKIDSILLGIQELISNKTQILTALGHYGRQRILLFNQNIGESRATGGFAGSYLPIDIVQGKLEIGQSQSIYFIQGQKFNDIVAHPTFWMYNYLYNDSVTINSGVVNLQYSSCYPIVANDINREVQRSKNGFSSDQIYMISPKIIEALLPDDFSTNVEGVGVINKSNFLNEIERKTSLEYATAPNPKEAISPIFNNLFDLVPEIVGKQSGKTILKTLLDGVYSRDISMWFADNTQQNFITKLGFGADQTCVKPNQQYDTISPVVVNMTGDKRGLISEFTTSITSQSLYGGKRIQVTLNQNLPELKDLQRGFNGENPMNMFGMQIPGDATDITIASNDTYQTPFLRPGFKEILDEKRSEYDISSSISKIIETSYDIPNGFVYSQIDGSKVVGSYIRDKPVGDTTLTVEFTIPRSTGQELRYYGQVGLGKPQFIIGEGVDNPEDYSDLELANSAQIQKGIRLRYR
jgi:hypothetical protein